MATFSAHTASPPPPSRTPARSRASGRHASIAQRTTSARGPPAWAAPRTRTHRSIPALPTPAGASRLPRAVLYPTPASAAERPSPDPRVRAPRSNRPGPGCSTRRTSLPRRSSGRRVPSNQASLLSAPAAATLPPSFRKSPACTPDHLPLGPMAQARWSGMFLGLLLVVLAAITWGTTGTTLQLVGATSTAVPLVVGAIRMLVAAPLLVAGARLTGASLRPSGPAFVVAGLSMAGYQVCYFSAVPLAGVGASALLAICSAPV